MGMDKIDIVCSNDISQLGCRIVTERKTGFKTFIAMSVKFGKRFARISERKANIRMIFAKPFGIFKGANTWLRLNKEYMHGHNWLFIRMR